MLDQVDNKQMMIRQMLSPRHISGLSDQSLLADCLSDQDDYRALMTDRGQNSKLDKLTNEGLIDRSTPQFETKSVNFLTTTTAQRGGNHSKWDSASFVYICNKDATNVPRKSSFKKKSASKLEEHLPCISPQIRGKGDLLATGR